MEQQVFGHYVATRAIVATRAFFAWHKVGGLRHWRVGRFGGSFYVAKPRKPVRSQWSVTIRSAETAAAIIISLFWV